MVDERARNRKIQPHGPEEKPKFQWIYLCIHLGSAQRISQQISPSTMLRSEPIVSSELTSFQKLGKILLVLTRLQPLDNDAVPLL